jgi:hypothetical protein
MWSGVNIKNINEATAVHAMKIFSPLFTKSSRIQSLVFLGGLLMRVHTSVYANAADSDVIPEPSVSVQDVKDAPLSSEPQSETQRQLHVQYSVFTHHFFPSPEHVNHNHLLSLEYMFTEYPEIGRWTRFGADHALIGGAVFKNSFGQPSQYLYVGQQWDINKNVYIKLTAGLLHGYKDQYKNKIPFNDYGTAPVLVPTLGFSLGRATVETIFLSNRAVMLAIGARF